VSVTNEIKREMPPAGENTWEYELDHIVPLDLGGAPLDRRNMQLQPWGEACNARQKDALEVKLSRMVCAGEITLARSPVGNCSRLARRICSLLRAAVRLGRKADDHRAWGRAQCPPKHQAATGVASTTA
jgi:hypothetical protein